jgi:hypothetical protein
MANHGDKRSVSTDALETLGTIIGEGQGRDAIHLAVEPSIAAHTLRPGDDVGFIEGGVGICDNPVGIVDPFLKAPVKKGQRFWLVVYPRQITSLRHVWTHPAFPEAPKASGPTEQSESQRWIEGFADRIRQHPDALMDAAEKWLEAGGRWEGYTYDNTESYKDHWDEFPTFWQHYAIVTGKKIPEDKRESFFTCSC